MPHLALSRIVHFFYALLSLFSTSQWHIGDSLRLLVAKNLISQYDTAGLLPLAHEIRQSTTSTAAGWDRALPCQILLRPLFISLQSLLEDVSDHFKVLHFLAGKIMLFFTRNPMRRLDILIIQTVSSQRKKSFT